MVGWGCLPSSDKYRNTKTMKWKIQRNTKFERGTYFSLKLLTCKVFQLGSILRWSVEDVCHQATNTEIQKLWTENYREIQNLREAHISLWNFNPIRLFTGLQFEIRQSRLFAINRQIGSAALLTSLETSPQTCKLLWTMQILQFQIPKYSSSKSTF